MKIFLFFGLFFAFIVLSGCSTRGYKIYKKPSKITQLELIPIDNTQTQDTNNTDINLNAQYKSKILYEQYNKWKDTPYKYGGEECFNGVDCSSFIQQVYYDGFGLKIPRTTLEQLKVGTKIPKEQLQVGDMIFFKTDWNVRHVGIIIKNGYFVHVSTSKGVMISSIHNPYWKDKYYQSRRVLP